MRGLRACKTVRHYMSSQTKDAAFKFYFHTLPSISSRRSRSTVTSSPRLVEQKCLPSFTRTWFPFLWFFFSLVTLSLLKNDSCRARIGHPEWMAQTVRKLRWHLPNSNPIYWGLCAIYVGWTTFKTCRAHIFRHLHNHTHTYLYVYIYIYTYIYNYIIYILYKNNYIYIFELQLCTWSIVNHHSLCAIYVTDVFARCHQ